MNKAWIKISKKLPNDLKPVLVYAPDCHIIGKILIGQYYPQENQYKESWTVYDWGDTKLGVKVTHWMPLPKEPNED